jgi:hypothetical protein
MTVPNVGLVNADVRRLRRVLVQEWLARSKQYAQKLFSGQPKELTKQILITTWQSLKNVIPKNWSLEGAEHVRLRPRR